MWWASVVVGCYCMHMAIVAATMISGDEKLELRRSLDEMTLSQIEQEDRHHFYHSYMFKTGAGNREELHVDSVERDIQFSAGSGVLSWQTVTCQDQVVLVGRGRTFITLLMAHSLLQSDRLARFSEHTLELGLEVTSSTVFTRWNALQAQEEAVVVVAVGGSKPQLLWYTVVDNKLVKLLDVPRYRKVISMAVVQDQVVVADDITPATVEVFDVLFSANNKLNIRHAHVTFTLSAECSSIIVCEGTTQVYLAFVQPSLHSVIFYKKITVGSYSFFENDTTLTFPGMSHLIQFSLANQMHLAFDGDNAQVFRLTNTGYFVEELTTVVSKWLAVPVSTYRSDVVLFGQSANSTNAYTWGGTDKGFIQSQIVKCEDCLQGEWSGAVSFSLGGRDCMLLPRTDTTSSLLYLATSLHPIPNPVRDHMHATVQKMKQLDEMLKEIQEKLSEAEESLKHVIKVKGTNVISAKWKLNKVLTSQLSLSSMLTPKVAATSPPQLAPSDPIDISSLNDLLEETFKSARLLKQDVLQREKEVWGLEKFSGKMDIKGSLVVDNLTVSHLNEHNMGDVLKNTYRKNKPELIRGKTVIHNLLVEEVHFNKLNNATLDDIKFSDGKVVMEGDVTFLEPVTVDREMHLGAGARVNGQELSKDLCHGEVFCAVFPKIESKGKSNESVNSQNIVLINQHDWAHVISGRNVTVKHINGEPWDALMKSVVFRDIYQQIPGTTVVNGTLSSDSAMWAATIEEHNGRELGESEDVDLSALPSEPEPVSTGPKIEEYKFPINPNSDVIFTNLEVTGDIICDESDWGQSAADVVLADSREVHILGKKTFKSDVRVTNNLETPAVNISDLLTTDTIQTLSGNTVLRGNITLGNVSLSGTWNGLNISSNGSFSIDASLMREVTANHVRVSETLNGIEVTKFAFTDNDGRVSLDQLSAQDLHVTSRLDVDGKVCNQNLTDFNERRLSVKEEQTLIGNFVISNANVRNEFTVQKLNNIEISNFSLHDRYLHDIEEIHLSGLFVDGNITTDVGVNGYNLTELSANAVWLNANNYVTGHLDFTDEVFLMWLDCQGFFNGNTCEDIFNFTDVVLKSNKNCTFSGKKVFLNGLNILEDMNVKNINGHATESILTKTTKQDIKGVVTVYGNVSMSNKSSVGGLINTHNLTDILTRCAVSNNTITFLGDTKFEGSVNVEHFKCLGRINDVNFTNFIESLVDVQNPQPLTGVKKFSGMTTVINVDVQEINNSSWDDFLLNTVRQNLIEDVESVTFTEKVITSQLSVDYDLDASSVNGVDLQEWRTNAIYLNDSVCLNRTVHLVSASSAGNISVVSYDGVDLAVDLIRLHAPNTLHRLSFQTVTVLSPSDIATKLNGRQLDKEHRNTIKIQGDQIISSDLVVFGKVSVSGNAAITGQVNYYSLQDVVTLDTDQHLYGNYRFVCVKASQNVTSGGLVSGVNMSEWGKSAVLDDGNQQYTGSWTVLEDVELKGTVHGKRKLASVDLDHLNSNITRDILDVHRDLKANLTSACDKTNYFIKQAQNQTNEFSYVKLSQELLSAKKISLVTHFQDIEGAYLTISDVGCTTTVYRWNQVQGRYSEVVRESLGAALVQLAALMEGPNTYMVSVSDSLSPQCPTGKNLWLFINQTVKHVSAVDLGVSDVIQVYNNVLYTMNASGVYKWTLQSISERVHFNMEHMWKVATAGKTFVPQESGIGLALYNKSQITITGENSKIISNLLNKWSGELLSVSASPGHQFVAMAVAEKTQIPRHSDNVKVFYLNGSLYDKLPAFQASNVHWQSVSGQIWLIYLQNLTTVQLYQLQGNPEGFQLRLSADIAGITSLTSTVLPLASRINPQLFLVVQTSTSVKILQTVLQGDHYFGPELPCNFGDDLIPHPAQ